MRNHDLYASQEASFITDVVAGACRLFDDLAAASDDQEIDAIDVFPQARILALRMAVVAIASTRGLLSGAQQQSLNRAISASSTTHELQEQLRILFINGSGDGSGIFNPEMVTGHDVWLRHPDSLLQTLRSLIGRDSLGRLPVEVLGRAYQALLDISPAKMESSTIYSQDRNGRKAAGKFYTPPALVDYIVQNTVGVLLEELARDTRLGNIPEKLLSVRILDPSSGCGDFLLSAARLVGDSIARLTNSNPARWRRLAAEQCVYGVDFDPTAVALARTALWLDCALPAESLRTSDHIRHADSLRDIRLPNDTAGFDAVIGNPPYVASKNEDITAYREAYDVQGQCDYYLLFLANLTRDGVVRPDGFLSMVLPDPFIIRGNAAPARRKLIDEWTMETMLHIKGMFPGAGVSNAVPVCRRRRSSHHHISVRRVDSSRAAKAFAQTGSLAEAECCRVPSDFVLSQARAEILYLTKGKGELANLPDCRQLGQMDVKIRRGEEIGKSQLTSEDGEFPVLLGGQSISPFRIEWEGRRIDRSRVRKPLDYYLSEKLLVQKSSGKLIAALDETNDEHSGFIVPQSVYWLRSGEGGPDLLYLLAIFNSTFMNDYVFRMFTGYKLTQPQIEIEDLKRLPIRNVLFTDDAATRRKAVNTIWPAQREDPTGVLESARQWLDEGRADLLHDLIVAITRDVVSINLVCPDRAANISMLDDLVSLLYSLPERVVL